MTVVTLKLEAIGDNIADHVQQIRRGAEAYRLPKRYIEAMVLPARRPWVAEIAGFKGSNFEREFLDGHKDFSEANGVGSRGVYYYFHLREGRIYEVRELTSWKRDRRFFCSVVDGAVVELDCDELEALLNERGKMQGSHL